MTKKKEEKGYTHTTNEQFMRYYTDSTYSLQKCMVMYGEKRKKKKKEKKKGKGNGVLD